MKKQDMLFLILSIILVTITIAIGIEIYNNDKQETSSIEIEIGDFFIKEQFNICILIESDTSGSRYIIKNYNNRLSYYITTKYDKSVEKIIKIERGLMY